MSDRCQNSNCFAHEGESCALGNMNAKECQNYGAVKEADEGEGVSYLEDAVARVPWSGSTLGLADLIVLSPRAHSKVVGVLGAHDAGKTTLLLGNYFSCLRGEEIAGAEFAGSWTLGAWEALAAWSRFDEASRQPHFPPHTPRSASRSPGLLHLALRREKEVIRDVLLTDAPGEWFQSWAVNENAPDAEGARWTVEHSDAFLIFADCDRLNGEDRGPARSVLRQLIERLGSKVNGRPVTLVWSKSDKASPEQLSSGIRKSIQQALNSNIPHAVEVETSVSEPSSLTVALSGLLTEAWRPKRALPLQEPVINGQPFSAFRGFHADS